MAKRILPPLKTLRAFEAAARHANFTAAADELSITHSAVSQQIRLLEEYLDGPLFAREARGVVLLPHARTRVFSGSAGLSGSHLQRYASCQVSPCAAHSARLHHAFAGDEVADTAFGRIP